ncbi:MAG TPA: galactokinase, partial [Chitinophagaceae bacterium]
IPMGAGLSSSAAIECAVAFGLSHLYNLNIDRATLAEIAQKAEHSFAGVLCGIMDQFASLLGKADNVIKLDCRSLDYEYVPLDLGDYKLVLLNTNVKHSLASSEYNTRRMQCSEGVHMVKEYFSEVKSLRDVTMSMLDRCVKQKDKEIYKRCKYIIEENSRLLQACEDLRQGNLKALGHQLYLSHQGLSTEYEVSCSELDFLVRYVNPKKGVLGARMMGGGFGGCTINIVHEGAIDDLIKETGNAYLQQMGKELTAYIVQTGNGTCIIHP